ncbi:MAG: lysine--tRNA ligase, partial [Clostridia bacterium]|nr:lysine--tRNA ligase [Clostridia bacterium]
MSNQPQNKPVAVEQDLNDILRVRREKLAKLTEEGNNPYQVTKFEKTHLSQDIIDNFEQLEGQRVSIAGRMVSRRVMGKASFCHVLDGAGKIQLYVKRDDVGVDEYMAFKSWDIGDIIGATGIVFRTQMGEISLHLESLCLLSKSLLPLPEKYHGLTNTDIRYRQRYVDLIVNPEV